MNTPRIPQSYEEWRHCIVVDCGLQLTPNFIEKRIASLKNKNETYTQQFIQSYGEQHHQKVIEWFQQAQSTSTKS